MRLQITWLTVVALLGGPVRGDDRTIHVTTPMSPPAWALLERELLHASAAACREFFHRYFDERGYLQCVERWGGDDGPDDAIENCTDWPILHALGARDVVLQLYKKAWEGHLRQYTRARTTQVPMAREGMYYKEFPVQFDWLHNAEGLTVFCQQGLSDPNDPRLLVNSALILRFTRASMLDVLGEDHIRTARAKGVSEPRVILHHALRSALIPVLTVLALTFALLVGGAIVTETVFGLPGIGNLVVSAVLRRDYPVIQGALLVIAALYVLINLATDLLYLVVDPRVTY